MTYVIQNTVTGELWEIEDGWSDSFADVFDEEERQTVELPVNGKWVVK